MVTVFGILNLTEDSFFDESRRLDPAGAVTAAIEMLRVGSDVVDVGPAASHPDARPVSPADEIRRIAPLLDALSDQMHRVSIDSFQPETQRYALKRGVGYLNDIQGFPDPALYPDIAEADCRLVVMHSAQRDGIATRTGHLRPEDALDEIVRFFEARVSALRRNFTRSAMALTTSAPTRLEICEAQSPSRKPSRNFAVATPETEG